jgi:hypothetical protein
MPYLGAKRLPSSKLQGRPAKHPARLPAAAQQIEAEAEAQQLHEMQGLVAAEEAEADAAAAPSRALQGGHM